MKVWTTVKLKDRDKYVDKAANAMTNYIYKSGPMDNIRKKYHISLEDMSVLEIYTASRIAGLTTLFMAKDKKRISDIINKYYGTFPVDEIIPILEGYIDVKKSTK